MASVGAVACFGISALSYLPFIGVALWVLPKRPPPDTSGPALPRRRPFSGLADIARAPHLRDALLTVLTTAFLCRPLVTFAPVLVSDGFHGNANRFSVTVGAFGVGGLVGALALLAIPAEQDRRSWASFAAIGYGIVVALSAVMPWFWALPALMVCGGAAMTVSNTSANSVLQVSSSPKLIGQTASLFMLAMQGGISLGSLLTGLTVGWLGVRHALLLNGALAIAVHLLIGRRWRRATLPVEPAAL